MLTRARISLLVAALALAGCDGDGGSTGPGRLDPPEDLRVRYDWIFEGWQGTTPVGRPAVTVSWTAPGSWNGEPFRVYSRRTNQGSFLLIATVTSCDGAVCRYVDFNVVPGTQYEYFVATADERSGEEARSEFREAIRVPAASRPPAPQADSVFALDNALFLRWRDGGAGSSLWKYQVFLMAIDATQNTIYQLGETDSPGFLDQRARNGFAYTYRVAAVDTLGHVSNLSAPLVGIPRPDYRGELIYAHGDSTARSGFRFASADSLDPVISGDSPSAQWRLEIANGAWQIRPLGDAEIVQAGRTTGLVCGPASDPGCRAVFQAPTSGYTRNPLAVTPEFSYVFRVRGGDGQIHYGVVRVTLVGSFQGKRLMIFDWAYQLKPNAPQLVLTPR